MANMMRGGLQFMSGFGSGYTQGLENTRKHKMEEERHVVEMERARAQNDELKLNKQVREELKGLYNDTKATAGYVVDTPDGRMVFTDEKSAQDLAAGVGAQVQPAYVAGGKTYGDKFEAEQAAERMNSPAARLRRETEIYKKYGMGDQAMKAHQLYQLEIDNNHQMAQSQMIEFAQRNDVQGAVNFFNNSIHNGKQVKAETGPDGSVRIFEVKNGEPVGQPQVFPSVQEFWTKTLENVARTPKTLFESVKFERQNQQEDKRIGLQERQVGVQEKVGGAQVRHMDAQTADIPEAAVDRRTHATAALTGAGAAATSAGAAVTSAGAAVTNAATGQTNAETSRLHVTQPKISAVPDSKGGLSFVTVPQTVGPNGAWSMGTPQVAPAAGLRYPQGYVADQRNSLGGLGLGTGTAGLQVDPSAVESVLQKMQDEATRRAAQRNAPNGGWTPGAIRGNGG